MVYFIGNNVTQNYLRTEIQESTSRNLKVREEGEKVDAVGSVAP